MESMKSGRVRALWEDSRTRGSRWLAVHLLVWALVGAGCERKPRNGATDADIKHERTAPAPEPKSAGPQIVREDGPMPAPDTVLGKAGQHTVTVADFEEASRESLLFAPEGVTEMPPERLAIPHIHVTLTRSLLGQKVMLEEATKRGILPTDEELVRWLRTNDKLKRFGEAWDDDAALQKLLAPYDLEREDLLGIARAEIVKDRLADALVADVAVEEVWKAYQTEKTTRTLALVSMPNVPSSEEIDELVEKKEAEIDAYFQKNPAKFRIPRRARVHLVRPAPGKEVSEEVLKKAAEDLERGVQPVTVARTHGLEHELGVELVKAENPRAFAEGAGSVGYEMKGPRGAYAWKVQGFEASRLPELTRPLRREIAAEMLRTQSLAPSVQQDLEVAAQLLAKTDFEDEAVVDSVEKQIEGREGGLAARGPEVQFEILTTTNHPGGVLPGHGLAEEVLASAFDTKVGAVSKPVLSRERGFVFRVLDKHDAARKEFEAHRDANVKAYQDAYRPRALQFWVEGKLNELGATVDTKPLRVKYGVLEK